MERFFVKAGSVNQVRKVLDRAPGGAQVIGRYDRQLIECGHTMSSQSLARHWPILLSRFEKGGMIVVDRPKSQNEAEFAHDRAVAPGLEVSGPSGRGLDL